MSTKTVRFTAALGACVLSIMLLPFAVPVFSQTGGASAFASGTVLHADLLQSGATKLVDAEIGFSGAAFNSGGLRDAVFNEMDRVLAPRLPDKLGFGRASAVEVGLGVSPTTENQAILAGKAEASSLPNIAPVTQGAGPIDLDPLVWADLLRGQAASAVTDDGCALGTDASNGFAYIADAQVLDTASASTAQSSSTSTSPVPSTATPVDQVVETVREPVSGLLGAVEKTAGQVTQAVTGTPSTQPRAASSSSASEQSAMPNVAGLEQPLIGLDADGPARAVSHSRSRTVFVAQRDRDGRRVGNAFGMMSEVRQTIAPVTLLEGTPYETTIELLGEWVLQSVAGGLPGTGFVHYGPAKVTPETPVLRIIQESGVTKLLNIQDLFGNDGLVLNIPGIAEIAIGEPPRAIDGDAGSRPNVATGGTSTAAAVDVVRVRVLPGAPVQLSDLRIGHMETQAKVPAGGVSCSVPVAKTPSVSEINVGRSFDVTFTITNPYECTLSNVRLEDAITTEDDARFEVLSAQGASSVPQGAALDSGTIVWSDIGDIAPHGTRTMKATIGARGGAGQIVDVATANGTLADCADAGATVAGVDVSIVGSALSGTSNEVRVPTIATSVLSESSRRGQLPFTGMPVLAMVATALVLIAIGGASVMQASRR